jgi:hypothetical protein
MEAITTLIKTHKEINKELVEISDVERDRNSQIKKVFIHFLENKYI